MDDEDLLEFIDGAVPATTASLREPWRILVVDDDPDVHESTAYGLRGLEIEGRSLQLLHANSAAEALGVLRRERDVAVVLLDVVMETDNAGLVTVVAIRNELGLAHVRIILRTGQPGQAPEIDTIRRYDINDYKTKSELTRTKLYTTLTAAIRSYDQLRRIDASRRGLEKIVAASNQFIAEPGLQSFAEGVITQIAGLVGVEPEGVVCACTPRTEAGSHCVVVAAAGRLAHLMQHRITDIDDPYIVASLTQCLAERRNLLAERSVTLFFAGREGGDFVAFVYASAPLRDVDAHLLEVFCTNIALCAANVELVTRLRNHAFVDRMLGLPNRTAFLQHLDDAVAAGGAAGHAIGLMDVDQFAETNDMFGHGYGDQLLAAIAQRLGAVQDGAGFLARVAGDTFGLFGLESSVNPERLRSVFEQPFEIENVLRPVSVCMGFVRCDDTNGSGLELLKDASIALKRAKELGQGRSAYYSAEVGTVTRERTRMLHGLQRAFDHEHLFVVYQPQVNLADGRPIGVEALLRWRTDDGKFVPPDRFIPVAEQSGLIVTMGAWVLRSALHALAALRSVGPQGGALGIRVAVNVSSVQFAQPQFLELVDEALRDSGVPPECLELEITESVAVMGMERVAALLRQIKARGIAVAIDDFGTGFSSLSYLDRLPADRLKIDRAFVMSLDSGRLGARIAEMIVPLGHQLGMQVLAEGVETEAQADILRALGCDEAQGYLYAKPMVIGDLGPWLAQRLGAPP
ncbi:EAL domain-containing protein [Rhodoferax sp. WC2427]|uniref:GGDEF/EAL domain-containing response regulator n=1 Tax=Rhodoferax sp. WC2427 TaxID=3234144 RepID=UPI0034672F6C